MPKTASRPLESSAEVKQAADEATKAAQEAAKAAAEASQNIMKGLSSFGGGFLGGGKQQKSGSGGLLGGFGFGGGTPAPTQTAQKQSKPVTNSVKPAQTKPTKATQKDPKAKVSAKEITAEDLAKKPYTAKMTPRERWFWSYRMIQQVNHSCQCFTSQIFANTENTFI